jgi:acetate kinase
VISADGSPVTVRVIPTDEEITIARQTLAAVGTPGGKS